MFFRVDLLLGLEVKGGPGCDNYRSGAVDRVPYYLEQSRRKRWCSLDEDRYNIESRQRSLLSLYKGVMHAYAQVNRFNALFLVGAREHHHHHRHKDPTKVHRNTSHILTLPRHIPPLSSSKLNLAICCIPVLPQDLLETEKQDTQQPSKQPWSKEQTDLQPSRPTRQALNPLSNPTAPK